MFIRNKIGLTTYKVLAIYWGVFLVVMLSAVIKQFAGHKLSYDPFETQPAVTYDEVAADAVKRLRSINHYQTVVAVGLPVSRAQHFETDIRALRGQWQPHASLTVLPWTALSTEEIIAHYQPMADGLMSMHDQVQILRAKELSLSAHKQSRHLHDAHEPLPLADDPLGYFARWVDHRQPYKSMLADEDILLLRTHTHAWALMRFQAPEDLDGLTPLALKDNFESLRTLALTIDPAARVLIRGTLYEAALVAAKNTLDLITISTLILVAFGFIARAWTTNFRTALFSFFCTASGILGGFYITFFFFGSVSIWTILLTPCYAGLSFTLTAYLSYSHRRHAKLDAVGCVEEAFPAIVWIALSICVGFAPLWFSPITVWQQLGAFIIGAVIACTTTLVLTYHYFIDHFKDRPLNEEKWIRISRALPRVSLIRWQRSAQDFVGFFGISAVIIGIGSFSMTTSEETNAFITTAPTQLAQSRELNQLLRLPRAHQFFLVTAYDAENTLMAEEALRMGFIERGLDDEMTLTTVSEWMPSEQRYRFVRDLKFSQYQKADIETNSLVQHTAKPEFETWLATAAPGTARHHWLGEKSGKTTSIATVSGLDEAFLPQLHQLADSMSGSQFIDTLSMQKEKLAQARFIAVGLFAILAVGSLTISLFHYGLYSWRIGVPPLVGALATPAILSWVNVPFSLTSALAMSVIYGTGFALALVYQTHRNCGPKTLALFNYTVFANLLSFGFLALTDIPAIVDFSLQCVLGLMITALTIFALRAPIRIREDFR